MPKQSAVYAIASICLVAAIATGGLALNEYIRAKHRGRGDSHSHTGLTMLSDSVDNLCEPLTHPELCKQAFAKTNTSDPTELLQIELKVAIGEMSSVLEETIEREKLEKDPITAQAFQVCNQALDLASEDLRKSCDTLSVIDLRKDQQGMNDLKSWLSSSYSYTEMCLDAFESNSSAQAKRDTENRLTSTKEILSNVLAKTSQYASALQSAPTFGSTSRRLLMTSEPQQSSWVDGKTRKLLGLNADEIDPDVIVAEDGSGNYTSVKEALENVPARPDNRMYMIYVKKGVYQEYIEIGKQLTHIMMIGDGPLKTRFIGNLSFVDGINTYKTGTFKVFGSNFIAKDIGFENKAGRAKRHAVALHVSADQSIFFNCYMDGYQNTVLAATNRQFYRDCTISGTIDFVFGYASAFFQNCTLLIRKPEDNERCVVTADGRQIPQQSSGLVFQNCRILPDKKMAAVKSHFRSYLGRPWKAHSRTIFMQSEISEVIHHDGWSHWHGHAFKETCFFGEYMNKGPSADMSLRVTWPGIKMLGERDIQDFTAQNFIGGDKWVVGTGVPCNTGLVSLA